MRVCSTSMPTPLKQQMPLWYIGSELASQADSATALAQLRAACEQLTPTRERVAERMRHLEAAHEAWEGFIAAHERRGREAHARNTSWRPFAAAIGPDAIVVSEAVTNFHVVSQHMQRTIPGTLFSSGGGSLGYNGGAAFGIKLAKPDALVVAICGDGSYLFSQPSAVHWMARRYRAPFLHVVLNNGGWQAPRQAVASVHPEGLAAKSPNIDIDFPQPPDYGGIAAAAGGAHAETVSTTAEVLPALERALFAIRTQRRAAVIDVLIDTHA